MAVPMLFHHELILTLTKLEVFCKHHDLILISEQCSDFFQGDALSLWQDEADPDEANCTNRDEDLEHKS